MNRNLHTLIFPNLFTVLQVIGVKLCQGLSTFRKIWSRKVTVGGIVNILSRQRLPRTIRYFLLWNSCVVVKLLSKLWFRVSSSILDHFGWSQLILSSEVGLGAWKNGHRRVVEKWPGYNFMAWYFSLELSFVDLFLVRRGPIHKCGLLSNIIFFIVHQIQTHPMCPGCRHLKRLSLVINSPLHILLDLIYGFSLVFVSLSSRL